MAIEPLVSVCRQTVFLGVSVTFRVRVSFRGTTSAAMMPTRP
jgi:hypothetical protein